MISLHRNSRVVVFALSSFLIVGMAIFQNAKAAGENTQAQTAKPVTDCYESREDYTTVTRTENAVPEYGYPSIKCSKTTGAVLWYGDPFEGTIPMGEMPEITDETHGNFGNAFVKPREPHLVYFNMGPDGCKTCHNGKMVPYPKDKKPRMLMMHQDIVENSLELQHGRGAVWCLDCHSAKNRNKLMNRRGEEISFNQPQRICGDCHGEKYIDWRAGVHGKRAGSWASHEGKKRWWVCTECHNPHTVQKKRFNPVRPEPAPPLPRGMKNANHEREGTESH